jgi:hypothetical protein
MFRFRALVHDVEAAGAKTRVLVDVIHGAIADGDTIAFVGPGQLLSPARRVDGVVPWEPEAWRAADRPPAPRSQLLFTVADIDPSQIWKRGLVRSQAEDGPDRPILSPWAAVFEQLADEHDMLALADLARGEARLLANGETMHTFLGHADSERGVAQALVERLLAVHGDSASHVSSMDFVSWSRLRCDDSTPQQRAELVARLAAHGVELGFAPIR